MQRFWAAGYAATSVRDLGDAMGLGQASVYNAFGDKRTLFTQCLDRYLDANMRARIARVEKTLPPRQAIESFLAEIVERSLENRLGCLLVNSALEVAPHDPDIADVVAARIGELEAFFRRCVIAGQRDGSISPDGRKGCRSAAADHSDGAARSRPRPSRAGGSRGCCPSGTQHARKARPKTQAIRSDIKERHPR
jgi:Transcriptional regulator